MESLQAIDAALQEDRPSSEDPAVRALQSFALKVRAGAPRPSDAFLDRLDETFAACEARARLAKAGGEEPGIRRWTGDVPFTVRVLVADGHSLRREAVIAVLERDPKLEVVGQAAEGVAAIDLARRLKPDVMVLSLCMAGFGGTFVLERLRAELPETRAIVLTTDESSERLLEAVAAGAAGYLSARARGEEIRRAVMTVNDGGSVIWPELAGQVLRELSGDPRGEGSSVRPLLAARELEILRLVFDGLNDNEIGEQLYISPRTVRSYLTRIREKTGLFRPVRHRSAWTLGGAPADGEDEHLA